MDIKTWERNGLKVLEVDGRVLTEDKPAFEREVGRLLEPMPVRLLVRLERCEHLCSSALGALALALKKIRAGGGDMALCGPNDEVKTLFEITRLTRIMRLYPDLESAVLGMDGITS